MVNSANFGKRLQKIIAYYGLSATGFSEELSFNRSTISHLLSGRNKPSLEFVMKVLERFPEVELYWLLNGKGTFPSTTIKNEKVVFNNNSSLLNTNVTSQKSTSEERKIDLIKNETHTIPTSNISEVPIKISEATSKIQNDQMSNVENNNSIERIVIFYKNGTFKEYKST